jgi:hypothetical protein
MEGGLPLFISPAQKMKMKKKMKRFRRGSSLIERRGMDAVYPSPE